MIAFVLVTICPGEDLEALSKALSTSEDILEAHAIFGEWDIIIEAEIEDYQELERLIVDRVRRHDGVLDTMALTSQPAV